MAAAPDRRTRPSADATRQRILDAALDRFSDRSFAGASTREIAERAGVSQPSLNYHFRSKDELWRAAVDQVFGQLATAMQARIDELEGSDPLTTAEQLVREFVVFSAAHPQLHRIIAQESKEDSERLDWLVERHVRPLYEQATGMFEAAVAAGAVPDLPPEHLYYLLVGAGPTMFVHAPAARRLTGVDPLDPVVVQAHADAVVTLLFGRRPGR